MYLKRHNIDERDQEKPRIWRAAIYLGGRDGKSGKGSNLGLSIHEQRTLCRSAAHWRRVHVVDEFVDTKPHESLRPGLQKALEAAQKKRLDYLIVSSMDRLTDDANVAFEVAWRLGHAGTVPVPAEAECELVCVGAKLIQK
jgi:hypothetical protein